MQNLHCLTDDSAQLEPTASGTLDGKTFVAKDLVGVAGHISSFGHAQWRNTHEASQTTAPVIATSLNAGAKLIGMVKLDQLAYSLIGNIGEGEAPINSLYPDRFTGGSSSGTASAVAGEAADFGIGTDTAGSIRVPAAACGIYAIRPTHGLLDNSDIIPLAPSLDVTGLVAKDAVLLKDVFDILNSDQTNGEPIRRILLPLNCNDLTSSDGVEAVQVVSRKLAEQLKIEAEEIDISYFTNAEVAALFTRIQGREIWATHKEWLFENRHFLNEDVQMRLGAAEVFANAPANEAAADNATREDYKRRLAVVLEPGTVLVMPVLPDLPPKRDSSTDELITYRKATLRLNALASLAGNPEVAVPIKVTSGKTYGVGLLGAAGQDSELLKLIANL